jgi:Arc/MetJ family transcription regulator
MVFLLASIRSDHGHVDYISCYNGSMKTTIDIPDKELADAMRFTKARTKREAVVTALHDFNRRRRMGALLRHTGTCDDLVTVAELRQQRRKG